MSGLVDQSKDPYSQRGSISGRTFTIGIWGPLSLLDPPVPVVEQALRYQVREFAAIAPHGCVSRISEVIAHLFDHRGRLGFATGLVPRVAAILERLGGRVEIVDHRVFGPQHAIDPNVTENMDGGAPLMLAAMGRHPVGQIVIRQRDITWAILLTCRAFAQARIVIAVASKRQAKFFRRCLGQQFNNIGVACSGAANHHWRITVATFRYLGSVRRSGIDVLLLPYPTTVPSKTAQTSFYDIGLDPYRVYAFAAPGMSLTPSEAFRLEQLVGPVIYRAGPELAAVVVRVLEPGTHPQVQSLDGLARKRAGYWQNAVRNDFIVTVVQSLVHRDINKLWALGLLQNGPGNVLPSNSEPPYVAIIVESVEHGGELLRRLPGWKLIEAYDGSPLSTSVANRPATGFIITTVGAANHVIDTDILIRASGDGRLVVPAFPPIRDQRPDGQIVLVDLRDDFDDTARRESKRRGDDYRRKGWSVPPAPEAAGRGTEDGSTPGAGKTSNGDCNPAEVPVNSECTPTPENPEPKPGPGSAPGSGAVPAQRTPSGGHPPHRPTPAELPQSGFPKTRCGEVPMKH